MNIKTTLGLGIAVVIVSAAYVIFSSRGQQDEVGGVNGPAAPEGPVAAGQETTDERSLSQPPLSDDAEIKKIVFEPRGKPRMVFQRRPEADGTRLDEWMMIEPTRCQAAGWTVNDVALAAKRLKYASKYKVGNADGVTLEQAGLRPEPQARLAVSLEDGETFEFEIGDTLIGQRKRYVFLPTRPEEVFVAEEDFSTILNREMTQFREKKLFRITTSKVVELEVTERREGETTTYQLKKQDDDWVFVAPFQAQAVTKKIQEAVNGMNRIRAAEWVEHTPGSLTEFGLDKPFLRVKVTTEEVVEKPKVEESPEEPAEAGDADTSEEEEEAPEKEVRRQEFVLLLSDQKPIGDDKKVYAKRAEDEQVGMVNATELDKFTPKLTEWRDMKLFAGRKPSEANSVKIRLTSETIEFELRGNDWYFSGSDEQAEPAEVTELLASLELLKAVSFVEAGADPSFGLEAPAAAVTLGFADSADVESIRIGDFTEQVEKRLRYVQRMGTRAVGKVRNQALEDIFRRGQLYRNREIFNYPESRLLKIELSRRLTETGRKQFLALARGENKVWRMEVPTLAEVDLAPVNEMARKLAKLRGTKIVDELNPDNLGLGSPDVEVTLTIEGVPTLKESEEGAMQEVPGKPIIRRVNLSKRDGQVYAHRLDLTVFMEVDAAVYDALMAEVLDGVFWKLEQSQIVAFGSKDSEREVGFRKVRERWQYSLEPDIPIDPAKIEQHLSKMLNLKTARFVEYSASNLADYGLDSPTYRFFFELQDGTVHELLVSSLDYRGEGQRLYATVTDSDRIFTLEPTVLDLGVITLSRFEADD